MDTYKNIIAGNDYGIMRRVPAVNVEYNHKRNFLIVIILIQMISALIVALV